MSPRAARSLWQQLPDFLESAPVGPPPSSCRPYMDIMPRAGPLSSCSLTQSTVLGGQPLCALGFQDTTLSSNFLPRRSSHKHHRCSPRLGPQATSLRLPWLPWRPRLVPWVSIPSGCAPRHTELSTLDCEPSSFIQPSTRHLSTRSQVELRPQPHLLVTSSPELMPLNACLLRLCVPVTSLFPTSARAEFLSRWPHPGGFTSTFPGDSCLEPRPSPPTLVSPEDAELGLESPSPASWELPLPLSVLCWIVCVLELTVSFLLMHHGS